MLQSDSLGYPISVLQGHTAPISFISFHRHSPHMLLSSSLDGTCRIWDAHAGGTALHTLATGPSFGPSHQLPRGLPVTTRHAQAAARVDGEAPPAAEAAANENVRTALATVKQRSCAFELKPRRCSHLSMWWSLCLTAQSHTFPTTAGLLGCECQATTKGHCFCDASEGQIGL